MAVLTFTPAISTISPEFWDAFDMANIRLTFVQTIFESEAPLLDPTFFRLRYTDSTLEFQGNALEYALVDGEVLLTAGTLTGLTVTLVEGVEVVSLTGLSLLAPAFSNELLNNNSAALLNLLVAGDDLITSGAGADVLVGYLGDDTIRGGDGADLILGEQGRDRLLGDSGGDRLEGGGGADALLGGAGSDILIGGLGLDRLAGGAGQDRFVFQNLRETGEDATSADLIVDFVQGQDRIDLRGIDAIAATARDDAFLFIGTAAFGATTAGEVRFRTVDLAGRAGDHTLIEIDIDGDAGAEAVIRLNGLHTLTAGDFLL